eukprot:Phypoly_transcript_01071.p1 GENE.Phypoly_transcript_01071~~Phypoly_transcript_01071.p1  ORF type:complete len:1197 (-),score=193.28 Phypoly_transcript_01071:69-3659(-)
MAKWEVIHQGHLENVLLELFPAQSIFTNSKKHEESIKDPATGITLQVDFWLPQNSLAFEFQDSYHYATTWYSQRPLHEIKQLDVTKRELLHQLGISLIFVPCWWDSTPNSLISTILFERPDVPLLLSAPPPSLNPQINFLPAHEVPEIGEAMLAHLPDTHSMVYDSLESGTNWWLGEKYDGIRCLWNPLKGVLYGRRGGLLNLQDNIENKLAQIPIFLDGEMWNGRGMYLDTHKILFGDEDPEISWLFFRIVAFDVPCNQSMTYEDRYTDLLQISSSHEFIILASRMLCTQKRELSQAMKSIIRDGGEGVILQKPGSLYTSGRSGDLMKLKATAGDSEALVICAAGREFTLQLPNGISFKVTQNFEPGYTPKLGDIVTFEHDTFSRRDVPINPKIVRIRKDMNWEHVVYDYRQNMRGRLAFARPSDLWMANNLENIKAMLENHVKKKNKDPALPETWYPLSWSDFSSLKLPSFLFHYSYVKVIMKLFPDIGLVSNKFQNIYGGFWHSVKNRKLFFDGFAARNGFDPLIASNWYNIAHKISSAKGYKLVLDHYQGSLIRALVHIYPDIGLQIHKFEAILWAKASNRNFFFDYFAGLMGFDPHVKENWYSVTRDQLSKLKGLKAVLAYHKKSFIRALLSLYPNIGLDKTKFSILPAGYWSNPTNRRHFFDTLARNKNFDPLAPENWYSLDKDSFQDNKDLNAVLRYYDGKVEIALVSLYPEIGIDISKFALNFEKWSKLSKRLQYFKDFAETHNFDPHVPENWYSFSRELQSNKDMHQILTHHKESLPQALIDLFPRLELEKKETENFYWAKDENRKRFFDSFAEANGFDANVPENWYSVAKETLQKHKGFQSVVSYHKGSYKSALLDLYPSIGLQAEFFNVLPKGYWAEKANRRHYFDTFAKQNSFDALIPENWYQVTREQLNNQKGLVGVLEHHNGSFKQALIDLYPELGIESFKFLTLPKGYWTSEQNRKQFFDEYALAHNFDPLVAANWYSVTKDNLENAGSLSPILEHHSGSFKQTLRDLYPEAGIDTSKFSILPGGFWAQPENRKQFFVSFAEENGFDYNLADNWYPITHEQLAARKGFMAVMEYHGGNFIRALLDLFPNIGLDEDLFVSVPKGFWQDPNNRRAFFAKFAKKNSIDPLRADQWYTASARKLRKEKGLGSVLRYHQGSFTKALMQLYPHIGLEHSKISRIIFN